MTCFVPWIKVSNARQRFSFSYTPWWSVKGGVHVPLLGSHKEGDTRWDRIQFLCPCAARFFIFNVGNIGNFDQAFYTQNWTQIGMFRPIRMDHTNCLQVAIKTLQFNARVWRIYSGLIRDTIGSDYPCVVTPTELGRPCQRMSTTVSLRTRGR